MVRHTLVTIDEEDFMRVIMKTSMAAPDGEWIAGREYDIDKNDAVRLCARDMAEAVDADEMKRATAAYDKAEAREAIESAKAAEKQADEQKKAAARDANAGEIVS